MGENTKIEWATHTFNPWRGVWGQNGSRVVASEAMWRQPVRWNGIAKLAEDIWEAVGGDTSKPGTIIRDGGHPCFWRRPRVFCASLADVFEDWQGPVVDSRGGQYFVCLHGTMIGGGKLACDCGEDDCRPMTMDDLRARLFRLIDATPHLDWLLVTKRPENIRRMWPENSQERTAQLWGKPGGNDALRFRSNVWLLTSVEDQESANKRIPELLKCRALCPVLGLSMEPLLVAVDLHLRAWQDIHGKNGIDWIIAGGESGPGARPMQPDWVRSIRDQCQAAGVPFFFKQWGEWEPVVRATDDSELVGSSGRSYAFTDVPNAVPNGERGWLQTCGPAWGLFHRVGKKAAGRILDGRTWDQFPEVGT